ncbi:MAG: hypothetical protein A3K90_00450 [Pelodictyon luteolum]|uniref:DUF2269 domain-containing protein n=1 Tax=Pelodictyon luteolum TaxID=1100 RepID=A0A165M9M8_PELLU|nr:hypothetical protein [Pelodictyon luteolum]KZK74982.1 MAG: hypothetical protein A3K90_00450 [Pelodictyon luteolum]
MLQLSSRGMKWLKGVHLIAVACWIGGAVSLLSMYFLKEGVSDGGVLYGINRSIHHVDMSIVVVPGAIGSLLTGLFYSMFSKWGFLRHPWLVFKWVVTVGAILFGTFFLGPWETAMMDISGRIGTSALRDAGYQYNQLMNFVFGIVQVAVLVVTVFVSVFKPWNRKKGIDSGAA